jgi:hypothetical protein
MSGCIGRPRDPEAAALRARSRAAIKASYKAAQKLDRVGMDVILTEDLGQEVVTRLTSLPWSLAHGAWIVKVEGKSGGYDCARIRPLANVSSKAGTRLERGGA